MTALRFVVRAAYAVVALALDAVMLRVWRLTVTEAERAQAARALVVMLLADHGPLSATRLGRFAADERAWTSHGIRPCDVADAVRAMLAAGDLEWDGEAYSLGSAGRPS